jgi:RNA recognition motif-containing protein
MDNNKKLFVGGLNYSTTDDNLREFFASAGTVESATVIIDRMSGRSKGFGFVEMATEEEANAAIEQMNGKELDGRTISVNIARPKVDRPSFGAGGGGNRGGGGYGRH